MKINSIGSAISTGAQQLDTLASVVGTLLQALPIGEHDRTRVEGALVGAREAAAALVAASSALKAPPSVSVKKSEVEAILKPMVEATVAAEFAKRDKAGS